MSHPHDLSRQMFRTTLTQHILSHRVTRFDERLAALVTQIGVAAKMISAQVRRAGIIEVWGETGETNIQGEEVQKLDMIANHTFIEVLRRSGSVVAMASEEEDDWVDLSADVASSDPEQSGYLVMFDPLDGSSNIEVSTSIGTIFAIYSCAETPRQTDDLLRPGQEMIGAGYVIYGSSTVLVYADATRVDCFTLDPPSGEFLLSRSDLKIPEQLSMISINEYNEVYWPQWMRGVMTQLKARNKEERLITGRHVGSLVADFHRNLIKGGVYFYPVDQHNHRGKLRLLYECNPLAFIARAAGGRDTWGRGSVLDLRPTELHQRVGFYVGVSEGIQLIEDAFNPEFEGEIPPHHDGHKGQP